MLFAEAPAKHIVELARAEVRENPRVSRPMREFARVRLEDAEVGVHDVLRRHGHSCPIEVHTVDLGDKELKEFPFIRFSVWLQYLGLTRIMRQLCGVSSLGKLKSVLGEFWRRFRAINPNHDIFEMSDAGTIDLKFTIPYYSHSDEGRSYKKEALWIFSVHGAIGRGTRNYLKKGKQKTPLHRNQMGMNFVGPTLGSQFLFATMLREVASKNPGSIEKLLEIFAEDAAALARDGLTIEGVKLRFLHIGNKGDLPALAKVASLKRKFYNCPRAPRSKKACVGVCHQCLAGQEADPSKGMVAYPFEDLSTRPAWETTIDQVEPWDETPSILRGLPIDGSAKSQFFCFDIWHIFHLGIAKHFLASSFVAIVESALHVLQPFRSIEAKFQFLSQEYGAFCRSQKISMWVSEISRDTLQWPQGSACPIGKWNKGSASTTIMLFLGHVCQKYIDESTEDDEMLLLIVSCLDKLRKNVDVFVLFHGLVLYDVCLGKLLGSFVGTSNV